MRQVILSTLVLLFLGGCSQDEKPIDIVLNEVTNGAFIRTLEFNNRNYNINDLNDVFSVSLEEQDAQEGDLLESIEVYIRFKDNTITGTDLSTEEVLYETLTVDRFTDGPFGLPRTTLEIPFAGAMEATGISHSSVSCRDQFLVRLRIVLNDGRSFTVGNNSTCIIAYDTFFSSPFCYTINVVEPIDEDMFTGIYRYQHLESIIEGGGSSFPTFGDPHIVVIRKGDGTNVRQVKFEDPTGSRDTSLVRNYRFTISCDESVIRKNQIRRVFGQCRETGQPVLIGPFDENASISSTDDSVFELWFQEWDLSGNPPIFTKIRLTKQ